MLQECISYDRMEQNEWRQVTIDYDDCLEVE